MNIDLKIIMDINILRSELIEKAKKKGVGENFGDKEVKQLTDKYHNYVSTRSWDRIIDFELWCKGFGSQSDCRGS